MMMEPKAIRAGAGRLGRIVGAAIVVGVTALWLATALATVPPGGRLRRWIFDAETAFCSSDFVIWGQLVLAVAGATLSFAFVIRLWHHAKTGSARLLAGAVFLLVAWWVTGVAGDCAFGSDD